MLSPARTPPQILMLISPQPVEPAAPTSLSVYCPAPWIGESPRRPGSFHARPLVLVIEEMSPRALITLQFTVPVGGRGNTSPSGTSRYASLGLRLERQRRQAWRERSVSRVSTPYPNE